MRRIFLVMFVVFVVKSQVFGEKITAEAVDLQTLQNNPSIASARHELNAQKQYYYCLISSLLPVPDINFSSSLGLGKNQEKGIYELGGEYGLSGKISLFSGFADYHRAKLQLTKVKQLQENYKKVISDAICDVRIAYLNLMYAYELVVLQEQINHRSIENRDIVKLRYHSGAADLGSLRGVEANVKLSDHELNKAKRSIETASAELILAIGRSDTETILEPDKKMVVKEETFLKPDFDSLITKIPDFLIAKFDLDMVRYSSLVQKGKWWPTVHFSSSIGGGIGDDLRFDHLHSWTATLKLNYPLFSGAKRIFDTKKCVQEKKKALETLVLKKHSLKLEAIKLYNNWIDCYETISVYKFLSEANELQTEITKGRYMNGLVSYGDWHSKEQEYISSQTRMLGAKHDAICAKMAWEKFLGNVSIKDKEDK